MPTQPTEHYNWNKPVFPSNNLDVELDFLIDEIDTTVYNVGSDWTISNSESEIIQNPLDINFDSNFSVLDDKDDSVSINLDYEAPVQSVNGATGDVTINTESPESAIYSGIDRVRFNNTEFDSNYHPETEAELAWDNSEGLAFYWNGNWRQIQHQETNGDIIDGNNINISEKVSELGKIFVARGTNTNINQSTTVSWNNEDINTGPYSFDGKNLTISKSGIYEIFAEADFDSTGGSRKNPNLGIQQNNNWVGVLGRTGYMRDSEGHDHSSVHAHATINISQNDTIRVRSTRDADGGSVRVDRAQFYTKRVG